MVLSGVITTLYGLAVALATYLSFVAFRTWRLVRHLQSKGYVCTEWLPLVGCVPYGVKVNAIDGFCAFFSQQAKRFGYAPYIAPLLGSDMFLVVTEPRVCIEILRRSNELRRGRGFALDSPVMGLKHDVLFANSGRSWQEQRTRANPFFRPSAMRGLFDSIVGSSRLGEALLSDYAASREVRDVREDSACATMRVICGHIFGHVLLPEHESVLIEFFLRQMPGEFQLRATGLKWLPLPSRLTFFRVRAAVLKAVGAEIRRAEAGTFAELLSGETEDQKLADVMGMLFAGFETTSSTVSWALYFVSSQPDAKKAILEEIERALANRDIDELTPDDIRVCPLLLAAFSEALRLRPPAPGHPCDAAHDLELDGGRYFIPKDTTVYPFYSCFFVSEEYFDKPDQFDMMRWIDGRAEKAASKAGLSLSEFFTPFLAGQHVCIGRQLAEMEAQILLARWLSKFDFDFAGSRPPQHVLSVAFAPDSMPMRLSRRT